jgi:rare lipoprotein A
MNITRCLALAVLAIALVGCASRGGLPGPDRGGDAPVDAGPAAHEAREIGRGLASWYGEPHHGRRTANGEVFDMHTLTAAHKTLPFGTRVRVENPATGQAVMVRINDRGPFKPGRVIDLSRAAAERIGLIQAGVAPVVLYAAD